MNPTPTDGRTTSEYALTRSLARIADGVTIATVVGLLLAVLEGLAEHLPAGSVLIPVVAMVVRMAATMGYTSARATVKAGTPPADPEATRRLPRGPIVALLACLLGGCANTGVTARALESIAGGVTDAELYHEAKVEGDEAMRANLRDAWHELRTTQAELMIEQADARGELDKAKALEITGKLGQRLREAAATLEGIAKAQGTAEVHYQGLRSTLKGTVGLVRALVDREDAEQELRERGAEAGQAAVDAAKRLGAGAAGGPVGLGVMGATGR